MGVASSIVNSNLHTWCVFMRVSKMVYPLITWSPIFSFLHFFVHIYANTIAHNVLYSSMYCNSQNIFPFYTFLVKNTAFGFVRISCFRVLKLPPLWSIVCTDAPPPCSPAFYHFLEQNELSVKPLWNQHNLSLCLKKGTKLTNHIDIHWRPT